MIKQKWQRNENGAADVFLETEREVFRVFSLEERSRAVELYFATSMATARVVDHLGYPTGQCLERWLAEEITSGLLRTLVEL